MRERSQRLRLGRFVMVGVLAALTVTSLPVGVPPARAAVAHQFDPTMIIADSLFYDGSAMTVAQIQSFLDTKIGACTNGKCLNVLQVNYGGRAREVSTRTGRLVCEAIQGGTMSAAEVIFRAQTACGISAKVILVTLQKEQGLITSRAPSDNALMKAMGMACSDTAPCDSAYAGFPVQVVEGTRQLKAYYAANFARQPGSHNIGFHPNASCGSTTLQIQNYATAALYNYTPYQPNAAAMANLYGIGDGCSSYGNRNFWRYYTDWFGSTQGQQFITRTDSHDYLVGIDPQWSMWAYPTAGDSKWLPRVSMGVGWNGIEKLIGIGDFDLNGQRDVIGIDSQRRAWLYVGDGQLAYPVRKALAVDWTTARLIAYAGNANGDTAPDVAIIDQSGQLRIWPGDGTGAFSTPTLVGSGYTDASLLVGPGDLNGDGCGDLLLRRMNGDLNLLAGNCEGGYQTPVAVSTGWSTIVDIYSIDLTGDGAVDLLARSSAGQLHLWRGDGHGGLTYVGVTDSGWATMRSVAGAGPLVLPEQVTPTDPTPPTTGVMVPGATGLGDFDLDGKQDFIGVTLTGALKLYRGTGAGGVQAATPVLSNSWGASGFTFPVGDFNSDGFQDVGRVTTTGDMQVAYGAAGGTLGLPQNVGSGWTGYTLILGGFDWDGDARADVLARDSSGRLLLYRGNGAGGWLSATPDHIDSGWNMFNAIFAAGDFDGLGGVDLLARSADGLLRLYPNDGSGGFGRERVIDAGWGGFVSLMSPGDFNGSGGPDVLARMSDGRLLLYAGNGVGGFVQQYRVIDSGWQTMAWIG